MQALDELAPVRGVMARSRMALGAVLPAPFLNEEHQRPLDPQAAKLEQIFTAYDMAEAMLTNAISGVAGGSDGTRVLAQVTADVEAELAKATSLADQLTAELRAATTMPRPAAAEAAALANVRADLRMVLDPVPAANLPERLLELIGRDLADDAGGITAWLLTSTDWARLYLESRGAGPAEVAYFLGSLPEILAPMGTSTQADARRVLEVLEGASGVNVALRTFAFIVKTELDRIRTMVARVA